MKLDTLNEPKVRQLGEGIVAILFIAITEPRGPHLPLQGDRRIAEGIAEQLESTRGDGPVMQ